VIIIQPSKESNLYKERPELILASRLLSEDEEHLKRFYIGRLIASEQRLDIPILGRLFANAQRTRLERHPPQDGQ
jgi:hypothetical protein